MTDRETRIPLPSRSLVRPPVDERMSPRAPHPPHRPAGAEEAEPDSPQRVTTYPAVVDTQLHGSYGDAVPLHVDSEGYRRCEDGIGCGVCYTYRMECERADCPGAHRWPEVVEHKRQSRLSRWQAQR